MSYGFCGMLRRYRNFDIVRLAGPYQSARAPARAPAPTDFFGATLALIVCFRDCRLCNECDHVPRDGSTTFSDLIGKLGVLRVSCSKRHRSGCYRLNRLIERRGRDAKIVYFLGEIAGDCPKRAAVNWNDRCQAQRPDLPRVLYEYSWKRFL
jgi:hypothetical protein